MGHGGHGARTQRPRSKAEGKAGDAGAAGNGEGAGAADGGCQEDGVRKILATEWREKWGRKILWVGKFFGEGVSPLKLFLGALIPTLVTICAMKLLPDPESHRQQLGEDKVPVPSMHAD